MIFNTYLKSKIHRARVTDADLNYEGSITIGEKLLKAAGLTPYEKVDIYNINNGERFSTYIIRGKEDGLEICLNGAAARKAQPRDKVIICAYQLVDAKSGNIPEPKIIKIKSSNNTF